MSGKTQNFDVVIVGGGLAGLSLACLLGRHDITVACVDMADPGTKPKDERTTAISFGSRKILERAHVWQHVEAACPINDIQILDGASPVLLEFLSGEVEDRAFGWIVDNHDLKQAMMKQMAHLPNVTHIAPAGVRDFTVGEDTASVTLDNNQVLTAALLIGADGRGSSMRKWLQKHENLQVRDWSYKQRAVICMVSHSNPHNNIAVEHFWPEGPFAVLPAADKDGQHRSSVVFTEHGPESESLMKMSDEEFEAALAARFPDTYGDIKLQGGRNAYPLGLIHAASYIGPRMVLVADAAHGIHPIAGQGLNLGFRDLGCLDELVEKAVKNNKDLGDSELLQTYQRRRRPDNMAMVAMTDGLNRLFSNDLKSVRLLRRAGLKLVSRLRPAKQFFMKQAMGDRE